MSRRLPIVSLLVTLLVAAASLLVLPIAQASSMRPGMPTDRDCGDFPNQAAAQHYFLSIGGPSYDPDDLDADGDGIACDSLPCPCSYATSNPSPQPAHHPKTKTKKTIRQWARVIRVIDGDTIKVRFPTGSRAKVRLLGIDTPEVYGTTECGGPQASASMKQLLPHNTRVLLVSDNTQALKDRYGRQLRYVQRDGNLDVDKVQLRRGWAPVYVFGHKPFKRVAPYRTAQSAAQAQHIGIWSLC